MNHDADPEFPIYTPSGRVPRRAWLWFGAVGWPVALVLGWVYANALAVVTWKPADVLVLVVLWFALIALVTQLADRSGPRSPRFSRWAGASIGFLALYAHWVVVLKISGRPDLAAQFLQSGPVGWLQTVAALATQRSEAGDGERWHSWLIWALETVTTIALIGSIAADSAREPYSEARKAKAKTVFRGELVWPGASSDPFARELADRGTMLLLSMLPASAVVTESVAAQWWTAEVEGLAVEGDPAAHWLNVFVLVHTRDENGRVHVSKKRVIKAWQVDGEAFDALRQRIHPADSAVAAVEASPSGTGDTAPVLRQAVAALDQERFAAALESARSFIDDADPHIRADALRVCALASSRLRQWRSACEHYLTLFEIEPTAFNALQIASTSACAGNLAQGEAWLQKAHELNADSHELQPPRIDTAFLSALEEAGEDAATLPLLEKLGSAYAALPTLDDHFVWSYGLPFFGEFIRKSSPILQRHLGNEEAIAWYERLRSRLGSEAAARMDEHIADLRAS